MVLRISEQQFAAFKVDSLARFEKRAFDFLGQHAPMDSRPTTAREETWRGYMSSAQRIGLVTEQEVVAYAYACCVLGGDVAERDPELCRDLATTADHEMRLRMLEPQALTLLQHPALA